MFKNIDYTIIGGLEVTQETFDFMQQQAVGLAEAITSAHGDFVIVSGFIDQGTTYSAGWIVINGELLPFAGGLKASYIFVETTKQSVDFENATTHDVYTSKVAKLTSSSAGNVAVSSFTRLLNSKSITQKISALENKVANLTPSSTTVFFPDANGSNTGYFTVTAVNSYATFSLTFKWTASMRVEGNVLFTIPEAFRPIKPAFYYMAESGLGAVELYIDTTGEVKVFRILSAQVYSVSWARLAGVYNI